MRASVVRRSHFNAAHRLHNPKWSAEKNKEVFGLCNNVHYHGHNYEIEVKLTGEIDENTGYVYDMGKLSELIKKEIEDRFDHKNLNLDCEEFFDKIPSTENFAVIIYHILRKKIAEEFIIQIKLWETPRNYVEFPV
ncbi:MAG: 6-carboxytetrahydropterin synthase [Saprospiraceae bacterium]|nr:6-carboxytetrahydropterin synthase [Saprospiraceae bacterium]MBK6563842.1 6-carboxytetrahydropterin synthase [Saprospiraceae bacterium]MBK7525466.1 6-carboxytetrahydropterin synthase [Saprospiraceae bacterium]MBK8370444.1 6-carboxytetrahydropterin synthase [Saprospiraceae bacterium]MBK8546634.1 6-carboxytetrahydropterin synthase [Saprospiraceae bacterium]